MSDLENLVEHEKNKTPELFNESPAQNNNTNNNNKNNNDENSSKWKSSYVSSYPNELVSPSKESKDNVMQETTQQMSSGPPGPERSNTSSNFTSDQQEKRYIIKNIVIISLAFMFLFTAYNSMANLQSSINK